MLDSAFEKAQLDRLGFRPATNKQESMNEEHQKHMSEFFSKLSNTTRVVRHPPFDFNVTTTPFFPTIDEVKKKLLGDLIKANIKKKDPSKILEELARCTEYPVFSCLKVSGRRNSYDFDTLVTHLQSMGKKTYMVPRSPGKTSREIITDEMNMLIRQSGKSTTVFNQLMEMAKQKGNPHGR